MKLPLFMAVAILFAMSSCNPRVNSYLIKNYPPLDYKQEVILIGMHQEVPDNAEKLGEVKIGDTGFSTNCSYDIAVNHAKMEARKAGGNAVKIIEHRPPSAFGSSCHRITAEVFRIENVNEIILTQTDDELLDIDHAIFYVYRHNGTGFLVNYDLHLDDEVICRVKNNYKTKIKVYMEGFKTLWAQTETKTEVPVNIVPGKEYYVRCDIRMGAFMGRPSIEIVDKSIGKSEYLSIESGTDTKDVITTNSGEKITCSIIREDEEKVYFNMMVRGTEIETHINREQIKGIDYAD